MLARLIALFVLLTGLSLAGVAAYVYLHEDPAPDTRAAAIVVLSGPSGTGAALAGETAERVERGIALFQAGAAPLLVMSGGTATEGQDAIAVRMAQAAVARGVPEEAVRIEPRSHSTLQNAWYTARIDGVDAAQPVLLVTHRYHLPRAWASFRWAGFGDIALAAPDTGGIAISPTLLAEGVKWPFNAIRAIGGWAALAAGAEEETVLPWLR